MIEHARRFAAEIIGTWLVCSIVMLAAAAVSGGDAGRALVSLAYGLGVGAALMAGGAVCPVDLNPAVSLAMFTAGRTNASRACWAMAGQLVGATLAGLLGMWLLADRGTAWGMPMGSFTKTDASRAVVVEALLTAAWAGAAVGCAAAGRHGAEAAWPVALAVVAAAAAGLPWSGAALSPARSLSAAVAGLDFSTLWIGAAGPLAGGALAGAVLGLLGRGSWRPP